MVAVCRRAWGATVLHARRSGTLA